MRAGKKMIVLAAVAVLGLSGCGREAQLAQETEKKINIVCVSFPEYDWTRQIIGEDNENISLSLIADNGVDIHNYQPSVEDMVEIDDCDLLIYNGGTSEQWITDAVADSTHKPKMVSMMDVLENDMVEEEVVEGMEAEEHQHEREEVHKEQQEESEVHEEQQQETETHENSHSGKEDKTHDEIEYDEHVWLSLKHAQTMVKEITKAVQSIDVENSSRYEENADSYLAQLVQLDEAYRDMIEKAGRKTILFGDRFPFRYLTEDYGLTYYAAFPGCSSESEASFETIIFLAEKVEEEKLPCILTIDGSDGTIAATIAENVDGKVEIQTVNSLQAVNQTQIAEGITYLSAMEQNLEVLTAALQ